MNRLLNRVERLEDSKGGKRRLVCLYVGDGETEEEAKVRHFAQHPEDRDARVFLIVQDRDPTQGISAD